MASLTTNLFWGQGPVDHRLDVIEGRWPDDIDGSVFIVGPDKRRPGGHWFDASGLLCRIGCTPDAAGRITVEHRRIDTPLARIRRRLPWLFRTQEFMEVSPLGVSNLVNTALTPLGDRLFVGYDAGRPVEVDPDGLAYLTPVGSTGEWFQSVPGVFEPLIGVAAHAGADPDHETLYFVNYDLVTPPDRAGTTTLARWRGDGAVDRWPLAGVSTYDSIHDVAVTDHHVVFSDLPFVFEPQVLQGRPRTRRNQTHTTLWIVAKADLDESPPGSPVTAVEARLDLPSGHIFVAADDADGHLDVVAQHIPLSDLTLRVRSDSTVHNTGALVDPNHVGLVALAVQPSVLGRHRIDARSGQVVESSCAVDDAVWGGLLATRDVSTPAARARCRNLYYAGVGYDPGLVTEEWWRLYGDATDGVVAPAELPHDARPGNLCRVDVTAMRVAEVHTWPDGAFPSPPTFVPRCGATDPDDGYVVVVVHRDGPKHLQVFDAAAIAAGPIATATAPTFRPGLLLHSAWMPPPTRGRSSNYRIRRRDDVRGALAGMPRTMRKLARTGPALAAAPRAGPSKQA